MHIYSPPQWLSEKQLSHFQCAQPQRSWLFDRGSLTLRLQRHSSNQFTVQRLQQGWQRPRRDEASALGIPAGRVALIREVLLCGHGQPWIYARSVLPLATLNGPLRHLRRLDNRPLGHLLFNNPHITRGSIAAAHWPPHMLPARLREEAGSALWARRSVFRHQRGGILVTEVFLPALFQHAAQQK